MRWEAKAGMSGSGEFLPSILAISDDVCQILDSSKGFGGQRKALHVFDKEGDIWCWLS